MSESYRNESIKNWHSPSPPTLDEIKLGCLQRIADATEKMASSYNAMVSDRDWQKRMRESAEAQSKRLGRQIVALRGVITRMKRKAGGGA